MKKTAFTLIELIIVLAIVSILLGLATLKFSLIDKIGAKSEIQTFIDDYFYLRDLSISSGSENSINFTDYGYKMTGCIAKRRNLKYINSLNTYSINISETGYVSSTKDSDAYNLYFVSKKNPNIKWHVTIEAVGGYLSEKEGF